jgi:hypothetical protein
LPQNQKRVTVKNQKNLPYSKLYRGIFTISFLFMILFMSAPAISYSATDLDNDGVPDDEDLCPKLKEDYNPEYGDVIDGCPADFVPWYDEDYDGIQDHLDACPDLRETYNKFEDEDGCPDTAPADEEGSRF